MIRIISMEILLLANERDFDAPKYALSELHMQKS